MNKCKSINFLEILSEYWSINPEQVSNITVDEDAIYLFINGAEKPSLRIKCDSERDAQSFFTLWKMRVNDAKEKCNER